MPEQTISTEAGDAWRDHLLNEVVAFLDQNRDAIIQRFEAEESGGLTREQLEKHGLLDLMLRSHCTAIVAGISGWLGIFQSDLIR